MQVRKSNLSCFSGWLYKTRIGGRSYSSTPDNLLDFYTNKTKQHLQIWTYCHLLNLGETQPWIILFFYFSVVIDPWRNPRQRVEEEENFEVPKRTEYIQVYLVFMLCDEKAVNRPARRSSGRRLGQWYKAGQT